jgi:hypothetical protein
VTEAAESEMIEQSISETAGHNEEHGKTVWESGEKIDETVSESARF